MSDRDDELSTTQPFFGPNRQGKGLLYHPHELRLGHNPVIIELKSELADQQGKALGKPG